MTPETHEPIAGRLDVHLLDPFWPSERIYEACMAARKLQVRAVIVRPTDLEQALHWMSGTGVVVASTAGYPWGVANTAVKLYEVRDLLRIGAKEVEFYLSPARLQSRQFQHIEAELQQSAKSCHESGAKLTAVYSSAHLTDDLRIITTKICRRTEVDVVSIDGGDAELALMTPLLKEVLQLKLATPVQSLEQALAARAAGYNSVAVLDADAIVREDLVRQEKERLRSQAQQAPKA